MAFFGSQILRLRIVRWRILGRALPSTIPCMMVAPTPDSVGATEAWPGQDQANRQARRPVHGTVTSCAWAGSPPGSW